MLNRESILSCVDCEVKAISVPEWGGEVGIRKLSFAEIMAFQDVREKLKEDNKSSVSAFLVKCLCDANGERLFTDGEAEVLEKRSYDVLIRLAEAVNEHNGLADNKRKDTAKNSESGPTGVSTATSPAN